MRTALFIIICFTLQVFAADVRLLLEATPSYAADQPNLTTESMLREVEQFQMFANWHSLQDRLSSKMLERDELKKSYERAKILFEGGKISQSQLNLATFNYQVAESQVAELTANSSQAEVSATLAQLRVLDAGGAGDQRLAVANTLKQSLAFQKAGLVSSRQSAVFARDYFKSRVDTGRELLDHKWISVAEFEERNLVYQSAKDQVQSFDYRIEAMQASIDGLNRSIDRLRKK